MGDFKLPQGIRACALRITRYYDQQKLHDAQERAREDALRFMESHMRVEIRPGEGGDDAQRFAKEFL